MTLRMWPGKFHGYKKGARMTKDSGIGEDIVLAVILVVAYGLFLIAVTHLK